MRIPDPVTQADSAAAASTNPASRTVQELIAPDTLDHVDDSNGLVFTVLRALPGGRPIAIDDVRNAPAATDVAAHARQDHAVLLNHSNQASSASYRVQVTPDHRVLVFIPESSFSRMSLMQVAIPLVRILERHVGDDVLPHDRWVPQVNQELAALLLSIITITSRNDNGPSSSSAADDTDLIVGRAIEQCLQRIQRLISSVPGEWTSSLDRPDTPELARNHPTRTTSTAVSTQGSSSPSMLPNTSENTTELQDPGAVTTASVATQASLVPSQPDDPTPPHHRQEPGAASQVEERGVETSPATQHAFDFVGQLEANAEVHRLNRQIEALEALLAAKQRECTDLSLQFIGARSDLTDANTELDNVRLDRTLLQGRATRLNEVVQDQAIQIAQLSTAAPQPVAPAPSGHAVQDLEAAFVTVTQERDAERATSDNLRQQVGLLTDSNNRYQVRIAELEATVPDLRAQLTHQTDRALLLSNQLSESQVTSHRRLLESQRETEQARRQLDQWIAATNETESGLHALLDQERLDARTRIADLQGTVDATQQFTDRIEQLEAQAAQARDEAARNLDQWARNRDHLAEQIQHLRLRLREEQSLREQHRTQQENNAEVIQELYQHIEQLQRQLDTNGSSTRHLQ